MGPTEGHGHPLVRPLECQKRTVSVARMKIANRDLAVAAADVGKLPLGAANRCDCGLQPTVAYRGFEDGRGAQPFQLFHRIDHFAAAHHHPHGTPVGFL